MLKKILWCWTRGFFFFPILHIQLKHVFDFRKDKIRFSSGAFLYFHTVFLVIIMFIGVFWYFHVDFFNFLIKKIIVCSTRANKWMTFASFKWRVRCHPITKFGLLSLHAPLCLLPHDLVCDNVRWPKCHQWSVFFLLIFSLMPDKVRDSRFYFWFFNFSHLSFDFLFCFYFFYISFFFNLVHQLQNSHMFFFLILMVIIFLIFFLNSFIKVLLAFNFIIQL